MTHSTLCPFRPIALRHHCQMPSASPRPHLSSENVSTAIAQPWHLQAPSRDQPQSQRTAACNLEVQSCLPLPSSGLRVHFHGGVPPMAGCLWCTFRRTKQPHSSPHRCHHPLIDAWRASTCPTLVGGHRWQPAISLDAAPFVSGADQTAAAQHLGWLARSGQLRAADVGCLLDADMMVSHPLL